MLIPSLCIALFSRTLSFFFWFKFNIYIYFRFKVEGVLWNNYCYVLMDRLSLFYVLSLFFLNRFKGSFSFVVVFRLFSLDYQFELLSVFDVLVVLLVVILRCFPVNVVCEGGYCRLIFFWVVSQSISFNMLLLFDYLCRFLGMSFF